MNGLKRLLSGSRNQFGIAAIVTMLVVLFLRWPAVPEGTTDAEVLKQVLALQADLLGKAVGYIAVIAGILTGGTSLEDAFKKLFHKEN